PTASNLCATIFASRWLPAPLRKAWAPKHSVANAVSNDSTITQLPAPDAVQANEPRPGTPMVWRLAIAAGVLALGLGAYGAKDMIGPRGRALAGVFCFFGLVAIFSTNLRSVHWK